MARRELSRSNSVLTGTVLTVAIIGLLVWARPVVIPLAFAIFLTFILSPAVNRLRRWRLGRLPSVLVVVTAAVIVVSMFGWLMSWQVTSLVQELPDHEGKIRDKLNAARTYFSPDPDGPFSLFAKNVEKLIWPEHVSGGAAKPVPVVIESKGWIGQLEGLASHTAEAMAQGALSFLLVIFLLLGREDMRNRMIRLIGPRHVTATTKAVDDAGARISRYLRMQLVVNATFGAVLAIAFTVLQVRYAILWGFVAGLMRYVPYVGSVIGLVPPLLSAIAMSAGWLQPLQVLAVYLGVEVVYNTAIEPRLFGKSLGLSEVAQILSAAFWAFLWGPIGLILSGPLTACLLVVAKNVPQLRCLVVILGDEDPLPPSVTFFQRLTAHDRDEADAIVRQFVKSSSAEQTIDELLLPGLGRVQAALDRGDLDADDGEYIIQAIKEIADEVDDVIAPLSVDSDTSKVRLLIVAAGGPGDRVAVELLVAQLDTQRWEPRRLTETSLASDILAAVREDVPAAVVIVSLAPGGFAHLRYLSKRLQVAAPEMKLVIGRWGEKAISRDEQDGLKQLGVNQTTASLSETLQLLVSWRSVLVAAPTVLKADAEKAVDAPIGTLSAM